MNAPVSALSKTIAVAEGHCALCNGSGRVVPLPFRQLYSQASADPVVLSWSECRQCRGWFANPMPSAEQIANHWRKVDYANQKNADTIGDRKIPLFKRVLRGLAQRLSPGPLLDIGCNFGRFLAIAQSFGWTPSGFEPNREAAESCIETGFDVRGGWDVQECGFSDHKFAAITAIDVFCYSLHPFDELVAYHRLLRPGGFLAMRLTNKHAAIRALGWLTRSSQRDKAISRLLLGQFHSAAPKTIRNWLKQAGFVDISIQGRAMATPWIESPWSSRIAYFGADLVQALTLGTISLSPGILVFARRPQ